MHTAKLKKLITDLAHHDASKRRTAAEVLSEGDERAVYPLIKALRDENLGVQDAAMHSLMEIKGEYTAYMVLPLLRENSFLRNTAIVILREIGEETVPLLKVLLHDKDDDVRKFALDLILDIKICNYPENIVELLKDDLNANVRAAAAKALGALQYKKALPELRTALEDEEWVCFSALEALAELNDKNSLGHIALLLKRPSEAIRFAAIETLGKIGTPLSRKVLSAHLPKAKGFEKKAAIINLIRTGTVPSVPGIADTLTDMLNGDDWEEVSIAVKGLILHKDMSKLYQLIDLAGSLDLSNPEAEEKLIVLREAIESFKCTKFLIEIINDDSFRFRGKVIAIETAGKLRCKKAKPAILKLLNNNIRDIRRSCIVALNQIDPDRAKEYLVTALDDEDSHVRKAAVNSLGSNRENTAFEKLIKMLDTELYPDIMDEIVGALLIINENSFMAQLDNFSENIQEIVLQYKAEGGPEGRC